jgi:hypothetical protein
MSNPTMGGFLREIAVVRFHVFIGQKMIHTKAVLPEKEGRGEPDQ